MDLIDARSLITLWSLIVFLAIVVWAWRGNRRAGFDEAARLPLGDDEAPPAEPASSTHPATPVHGAKS